MHFPLKLIQNSFILLCLLVVGNSFAQEQVFPTNRIEFIPYLETQFTKNSKLEKLKVEFERFEVKNIIFTDEDFEKIINITKIMNDKKMSTSSYWYPFIRTLNIIADKESKIVDFRKYASMNLEILNKIKGRKYKQYTSFLNFCENFYVFNALRYAKNSTNWYADTDSYDFNFENNTFQVIFDNLNIIAARKSDTIKIYDTEGILQPKNNIWKGKGGYVNWDRIPDAPQIKVVFGNQYTIETKKNGYTVDSVFITHPDFFAQTKVLGSFEDRVIRLNKNSTPSYPRFVTKSKILKVNNFGKNTTFTGGLQFKGLKVIGYGTNESPSKIEIERNGHRVFKAQGPSFIYQPGVKIAAKDVEITIYFSQDSIHHPSINMKYTFEDEKIAFHKGEGIMSNNPFYNSHHKVNIQSEEMVWELKTDMVSFGTKNITTSTSLNNKVTFESLDYFNENEYDHIQNLSDDNPIGIIKLAADYMQSNILDEDFVAKRINPRFTIKNVLSLFADLSSKGFITYNKRTQTIEVKEKLFHYVEAKNKKTDFDNIKIESSTNETNATLDLKNKDLAISGIKHVELSQKQAVGIKPIEADFKMHHNRDIDFSGKVFAGYSSMEGKDFHFNYDEFRIDLDSIRFFDLFVQSGFDEAKDMVITHGLNSRIEHLTGNLQIDNPNNKSGIETNEDYPIMESTGNSYVYYDYFNKQGLVYKRDSFFYELDPFTMTSLDSFATTYLDFSGKLISADIFKPINQNISMQKDTSLGFIHQTPQSGYGIYKDLGNYLGEISLDQNGLLGKGKLTYQGTEINSEDFIFHPKEMFCSAEIFLMKEDRKKQPAIPEVQGTDVSIHWKPYNDSLYIKSNEGYFEIFKDNEHTLKGTLILTSSGLKGDGKFEWSKGILNSKLFSFGAHSISADTSDMKIKSAEEGNYAFDTKNVNSIINFDKNFGSFKGNTDSIITSMPYNQYKTTMNEFDWDMTKELITFRNAGKAGHFFSSHPSQDSLNFDGTAAIYNLNSSELIVEGVENIQSADAMLYLGDKKVEIEKGGKMRTLKNVQIEASLENKHHIINKCSVDVLGRKEFKATGFYEYNIGDHKQEIRFDEIIGAPVGKGKRSEKRLETRANGDVAQEDNFFMDHKINFIGNIGLFSTDKNLKFKGFGKIESPIYGMNWFSINSKADKKNVTIAFNKQKNTEGIPLKSGVFLGKESGMIYPRAMMPLYSRQDRNIIDVTGFLTYKKSNNHFLLGDSLKLYNKDARGSLLDFNNETGQVTVEGKMNLVQNIKAFDILTIGRAETKFMMDTTDFKGFDFKGDLLAQFDINIPKKLIKIMVEDFKSASFSTQKPNYPNDPFYPFAFSELIEKEKDRNNVVEKIKSGLLVLPSKYRDPTFFFGKVPFVWDVDYQSIISGGKECHLVSIGGEQIDQIIEVYMELKMPSNKQDRMYFLLKSKNDYFYFFGFKGGILSSVSNNTRYNQALIGLKKKEKKIKTPSGNIEFQAVEIERAQQFIRRIQAGKF